MFLVLKLKFVVKTIYVAEKLNTQTVIEFWYLHFEIHNSSCGLFMHFQIWPQVFPKSINAGNMTNIIFILTYLCFNRFVWKLEKKHLYTRILKVQIKSFFSKLLKLFLKTSKLHLNCVLVFVHPEFLFHSPLAFRYLARWSWRGGRVVSRMYSVRIKIKIEYGVDQRIIMQCVIQNPILNSIWKYHVDF